MHSVLTVVGIWTAAKETEIFVLCFLQQFSIADVLPFHAFCSSFQFTTVFISCVVCYPILCLIFNVQRHCLTFSTVPGLLQCCCLHFPGWRVLYLWLKSCNDLYMPFIQWKSLQCQWEQSQGANFIEWQNVGKGLPINSIFDNETVYFWRAVFSNTRGTLAYCVVGFVFLYLQLYIFKPIYEYSSELLLFLKNCNGFLRS